MWHRQGSQALRKDHPAGNFAAMNANAIQAPNLTQRPPRSPRVRLGGYVILARVLDKGRAELARVAGEYKYNNPTDQHWFRFTGIAPDDLKAELAKGKGDGEILAWIMKQAPNKREPWEIQQWSAYFDERGPDGDVETLEFFTERVRGLSETREDVKTWFDYLDLDDHVTFGGKA
jgi:hypothetical protein